MENKLSSEGLVIFIDIAGSTRLYERLGDVAAYTQIAATLAQIGDIVHRFGGYVIKHIGDEVLCFFEDVVAGFRALIVSQIEISTGHSSGVAIRIGCHYGAILSRDNDIYGDTVNIAAHLASLAKGQQIVTSQDSLDVYESKKNSHVCNYQIHEALDFSAPLEHRFLTQFSPKNKQISVSALLVYWEHFLEETVADWTFVQPLPESIIENERFSLLLPSGVFHIKHNSKPIRVGRVQEMDIIVANRNVSRQHGVFEYKDGQLMYIDQSSNGTYVLFDGHKPQFVHRQSIIMAGQGVISFGAAMNEGDENIIQFWFELDQ